MLLLIQLLESPSGLFSVPTKLIIIVAPINAFLNYILGQFSIYEVPLCRCQSVHHAVWGSPPVGMGFIGAPIATALSFNLMAIAGIIYCIYFGLFAYTAFSIVVNEFAIFLSHRSAHRMASILPSRIRPSRTRYGREIRSGGCRTDRV